MLVSDFLPVNDNVSRIVQSAPMVVHVKIDMSVIPLLIELDAIHVDTML